MYGSIIGKSYQVTMHKDDLKVCEQLSAQCFANPDKVFPATIRKHDGYGDYLITQWEYKAMFDFDNNPTGVFCLGYDVTDYKIQSDELDNARSLIDKKNLALKEIAFDQSHLIRSPLTNVLSIASILDSMEVDQNIKNLCGMLTESSRQSGWLIKVLTKRPS